VELGAGASVGLALVVAVDVDTVVTEVATALFFSISLFLLRAKFFEARWRSVGRGCEDRGAAAPKDRPVEIGSAKRSILGGGLSSAVSKAHMSDTGEGSGRSGLEGATAGD
jgi:hypothetical protein